MKFLILITSITTLFSFSFFNSQGNIEYNVWNNSVKAKLKFPFKFYGIGFSFNKSKWYFSFNTKLKSYKTISEDIDYIISTREITAFSRNDNYLKDYYNIEFGYKKKIVFKIGLDRYNFFWKNYLFSKDKILKYKINLFYLGIGIIKKYKNENVDFRFFILPTFVNTRDEHLLRNFYVEQNFLAYKYEGKINVKLTDRLFCYIFYEFLRKRKTKMNFYTQNNVRYLSLDSSWKEDKYNIGIKYNF